MKKNKLKEKYIKLTSKNRLYSLPYPIIALTGGIATGKTTVSNILKDKKLPVICADNLVRNIYKTQDAFDFISSNFPQAIHNNAIDFKILRSIFFNDKNAQEKIEEFIYARLEIFFKKEADAFDDLSYVIYDVPLLFEKELDSKVDLSICVYSPRDKQIERVLKRDNIDQQLAEKIIDTQTDIEQKRQLSDLIIDNTQAIENITNTVTKLLSKIFE